MFGDLLTGIIDYQGDFFRNIKTSREGIDCYDDLGDGDLDTQIAIAVELIGHDPSHAPVITRPFDHGIISYPYVRENWLATRFSDGCHFGVWYGSQEVKTTVYETVYHFQRFLWDAFPGLDKDVTQDRRVVKVLCQGLLVNLVDKETNYPALRDPNDYTFTNAVGRYLYDQNQNGLLVRSARCEGIDAAILNKDILSNPRDHCFLTYSWNPSRKVGVQVERAPGAPWMTVV